MFGNPFSSGERVKKQEEIKNELKGNFSEDIANRMAFIMATEPSKENRLTDEQKKRKPRRWQKIE